MKFVFHSIGGSISFNSCGKFHVIERYKSESPRGDMRTPRDSRVCPLTFSLRNARCLGCARKRGNAMETRDHVETQPPRNFHPENPSKIKLFSKAWNFLIWRSSSQFINNYRSLLLLLKLLLGTRGVEFKIFSKFDF